MESGEGTAPYEGKRVVVDTSQLIKSVLGASIETTPIITDPEDTEIVEAETVKTPVKIDASALIERFVDKVNGSEPDLLVEDQVAHIQNGEINGRKPVNGHNSVVSGGPKTTPKKSPGSKGRQPRAPKNGANPFDDDFVKMYLREIGKHELLTKEGEIELAQKIEQGVLAKLRLDEAADLSAYEKRQLQRAVSEGKKAKTDFMNANLRLVVSIAKKYNGKGLELLDLIQEGNLGLEHAVDMFEWRKGFKFSTYATWWIRQSITRAIANKSQTIRLPVHVHESARVYFKAKDSLDSGATTEEIAEKMGLSVEQVAKIEQSIAMMHLLSFDEPVKAGSAKRYGSETTIGELTPDHSYLDQQGAVENAAIGDDLMKIIKEKLDEREQEVVIERFGLDGGEPKTLDEVGKLIGLTRESARLIQNRAIKKLRQPYIADKLREML